MGYQIALTSLVVFLFSVFMLKVVEKTKTKWGEHFWSLTCLASMLAIPAGLIIQVWQ